MHRADFCLAGMFRDLFLFRRTDMLRALLLLVAATLVLFEAARLAGLLPNYPFPLLYAPSAANLAGGLLFGVGMVLAGGCVVGTLYRMGAGSLISAVAFLGLVAGSAGYAEIFPGWAAFVRQTTLFPGGVTLPQLLGVGADAPLLACAAAAGALLLRWRRRAPSGCGPPPPATLRPGRPRSRSRRSASPPPSWSACRSASPPRTPRSPAGPSASSRRRTSPPRRSSRASRCATGTRSPAPSSRAAPGAVIDAIAAIQFPLVAGIVLGAALSALPARRVAPAPRRPRRGSWPRRSPAASVMGFASRMAPTCNVWHLHGRPAHPRGLEPASSWPACFPGRGWAGGSWRRSVIPRAAPTAHGA